MGQAYIAMGWDRHKLLWDGTDKHVPWTTLEFMKY